MAESSTAVWRALEARSVVEALARSEACVLITWPEFAASYQALCTEITDDTFELAVEFNAPSPLKHLNPGPSPCLLSFMHAGRRCACYTNVTDITSSPSQQIRLSLKVPQAIFGTESRRFFRVPLRGDHGLQVMAKLGPGADRTATPQDISVAGIRIAFDEHPDPDFEVGQQVELELRRDQQVVDAGGLVRNRQNSVYGIHFNEFDPEGDDRAPRAFNLLLVDLQRHWLQHRVY